MKQVLVPFLMLYFSLVAWSQSESLPFNTENPYLLQAGKKASVHAKHIKLSNMPGPSIRLAKGVPQTTSVQVNQYTFPKADVWQAIPKLISANLQRFKTTETRLNTNFPSLGKKVAIDWPQWHPVEMIQKWTSSDHFSHLDVEQGLVANGVKALLEDQNGKVWIGTNGGISIWDGAGLIHFTHYQTEQGLVNNRVHSLLEDAQGNLWIGTAAGLSIWDGQSFANYTRNEGLLIDEIWKMAEDKAGNIWMASSGFGLCVFERKEASFSEGLIHYFTAKEGLLSNTVLSLSCDKDGAIWIGTLRGVHKISNWQAGAPTHMHSFQYKDGLRGVRIQHILQDRKNQIWLGTTKGIEKAKAPLLQSDTVSPKVLLRDLQPFYKHIDWRKVKQAREYGAAYLSDQDQKLAFNIQYDSVLAYQNLPYNPIFPYDINHLTFSWFGASNSSNKYPLQYQVFLDGKDRFKVPFRTETSISFHDLGPGKYRLKIQAFSNNGKQSETLSYPFSIRAPWWASIWAYIAYVVILFGALYFFLSFLRHRWELQSQLALEQATALRLKELDSFKSRLYTNITHEFRTPLTVILGMASQVKAKPRKHLKESLNLIIRNGNHLLQLINQLLDLSKLEDKKLQLQLVQKDIIAYLRYLTQAFQSFSEEKNIKLLFFTAEESLIMDHDPAQIKQVFSNLISNALKFTPAAGEIRINLSLVEEKLLIAIADTGIGIPEKDLPFIFDRFFQAENNNNRISQGTGIGLAHARELIHLMGGEIFVKSKLQQGTEFSLYLPITQKAPIPVKTQDQSEIEASTFLISPSKALLPKDNVSLKEGLPQLLVVEDNPDVVFFLNSCLEDQYHVLLAENGKLGLEMALKHIPDIIISDVMMPEMDGFTLCQRLKTNIQTSHIPIILLTAKADVESRLTGLGTGADAYLEKPFIKAELFIRLEKLLVLRRELQKYYSKTRTSNLPLPEKPNLEEVFLQQIKQLVLDHLDDPQFGYPQLAKLMLMSESQLFRKIKALTGRSTAVYMRSIRLQKAKELLNNSDLLVSEIAFQVGFDNPSYFSRTFTAEFGVSPNSLRQ